LEVKIGELWSRLRSTTLDHGDRAESRAPSSKICYWKA